MERIREGFTVPYEVIDWDLTDEQFGVLISAMHEYGENGELTTYKDRIENDAFMKEKFELFLEKTEFFKETTHSEFEYYKK